MYTNTINKRKSDEIIQKFYWKWMYKHNVKKGDGIIIPCHQRLWLHVKNYIHNSILGQAVMGAPCSENVILLACQRQLVEVLSWSLQGATAEILLIVALNTVTPSSQKQMLWWKLYSITNPSVVLYDVWYVFTSSCL